MYRKEVPKLWNESIEAHRNAVRDATLDAAARLVAEHGLLSVTMSRVAGEAGIGRATLYKYFPDVESILTAWHERQVTAHLEQLISVRDQTDGPTARLQAVLETYATLNQQRHEATGPDLIALLHRGDHVVHAHGRLTHLIRDLLAEGARSGDLRDDIPPDELADYCLHALTAARGLRSEAAVHRLITVTMTGLRPAR